MVVSTVKVLQRWIESYQGWQHRWFWCSSIWHFQREFSHMCHIFPLLSEQTDIEFHTYKLCHQCGMIDILWLCSVEPHAVSFGFGHCREQMHIFLQNDTCLVASFCIFQFFLLFCIMAQFNYLFPRAEIQNQSSYLSNCL